jgi:hypothetical protein
MVLQQEKAFGVLRFEVSRSVITVQREFCAQFRTAGSACATSRRDSSGSTERRRRTPFVIPNSNYIIIASDSKCLKYILRASCTVIIR